MNGTMLHQTSDSERKVTSDAHYIKVTSKMYNFYLIDMYIYNCVKRLGIYNVYATLFYFE